MRTPFKTTYEVIQTATKNFAKKPAIIFLPTGSTTDDPVVISYEMLLTRVNQAANLFLSLSTTKTISYLLPNLPQTHFVLWGAEAMGAVNPIRPDLSAEQILAILRKAKSDVLVTIGEFIAPPIWQAVLAVKELRSRLTILVIGGKPDPANNIYSFDELLEKQSAEFSPNNISYISRKEVCAYFHTSATTSVHPKLCRHTHHSQLHVARAMEIGFDYHNESVFAIGLPFFHVGAPTLSLAAFMCGATTIMMSPMGWMEPNVMKNFWQIVKKYQVTHTAALGFMYAQLSSTLPKSTSLRIAIAGMPTSPDIVSQFKSSNIDIVDLYGSTETIMACFNQPQNARVGSMGLPIPFAAMKVMTLDGQRVCAENEVGELWIMMGPNLTDGYQETDGVDQSVFVRDSNNASWFCTGDLVQRDKENYFWFFDRLCDAINHHGVFISSIALEKVFESHPKVDRAAVIAQFDKTQKCEVPVLFVTVKNGMTLTTEELQNFARQNISKSSEMPTEFFIEEKFPLNGIAKVMKPALREKLHREQKEPALML